MADNNFRSDRSRDPLAELARLIGQADLYSDGGPHEFYNSARSTSAATVPADVDWAAAEDYGAHDAHPDERYAPQPAPGESINHMRRRSAAMKPIRRPAVVISPARQDSSTASAASPTRTSTTSRHRFLPRTNCRAMEARPIPIMAMRPVRRRMATTLTQRTNTTIKLRARAAGAAWSRSRRSSVWRWSAPLAPSAIGRCSAVPFCRRCRRSSRRATGRSGLRQPIATRKQTTAVTPSKQAPRPPARPNILSPAKNSRSRLNRPRRHRASSRPFRLSPAKVRVRAKLWRRPRRRA